jgi:hypothetical protein
MPLHVCNKVDEPLVTYRHVGNSLVSKTPRKHLLRLRVEAFEKQVLSQWCDPLDPQASINDLSPSNYSESAHAERKATSDFVVWGAGRDGRDFVNMLQPKFRARLNYGTHM